MNLINSYIIEQPKLATPNTGTALVSSTDRQQKNQQAQDSYRKNAANAEIIDAEYIDYRPNNKSLSKNQQAPPIELAKTDAVQPKQENSQPVHTAINKYNETPIDSPLPGTYINTFA